MDQKKDIEEAKEVFLKLLPIIPIVLTLVGSAKLFSHYQKYNINIFYYIDLNEILTLFISDIYYFIFSVASFYIFQLIDFDIVKYINDLDSSGHGGRILKIFLRPRRLLGLLTIITYSLLMVAESQFVKGILAMTSVALTALLCISVYVLIVNQLKSNYEPITAFVYKFYVFTSVSIFGFAYSSIIYDLTKVENPFENSFYGSSIITGKVNYDINEKNILIGRTKNYVFIYKVYDKCTDILPASQILELHIKSGKK